MNFHKVTLSASGKSDPIQLFSGTYELDLFASTWDAGNAATIEYATENINARFAAIEDPSTGSAISRTAAGSPVIILTGGGYVRIGATDIGSMEGLTLIAKRVSA